MTIHLITDKTNNKAVADYSSKLQVHIPDAIIIDSSKPTNIPPQSTIHIQYHPDAHNLDVIATEAKSKGSRVVTTYHEVARVKECDRSALNRLLEVSDYHIFTTEIDRSEAKRIKPTVDNENSAISPIPSNFDVPASFPILKIDEGNPDLKLIYFGMIHPEKGIETFIELIQQYEAIKDSLLYTLNLTIAGKIDPAQREYASKIAQNNLPIEMMTSENGLTEKQVLDLLGSSHFAFIPFGNPSDPNYGGVSAHSGTLPLMNLTNTILFSFEGKYTDDEIRNRVSIVDSIGEVSESISDYVKYPDRYAEEVSVRREIAQSISWEDVIRVFSSLVKREEALQLFQTPSVPK